MAKANGKGREATLSSALQGFEGKTNVPVKVIPKWLPEGDVNERGPARKQSAKSDQGKGVFPSINTLADTQS